MIDNHTLCRNAGIAYIPPRLPELQHATRYRPRPIGRQGWIAIGLGIAAVAIGVTLAVIL